MNKQSVSSKFRLGYVLYVPFPDTPFAVRTNIKNSLRQYLVREEKVTHICWVVSPYKEGRYLLDMDRVRISNFLKSAKENRTVLVVSGYLNSFFSEMFLCTATDLRELEIHNFADLNYGNLQNNLFQAVEDASEVQGIKKGHKQGGPLLLPRRRD